MTYFNRTELRSLFLATGLLLLGATARLGLGPKPDDFSWTEAGALDGQPSRGLSSTRRKVSDRVAEEELAARPLGPGERLDPNTAAVAELRRLPGVGPVRAQAIVKERVSGGKFRSPSDLARVPGIGPHAVRVLTPHLAFGFAPSARRPDPDLPRVEPFTRLVDVNRAQIKELEQITGVGPVLAGRIIASRQRLGPFRSPEDLLRVPGIGPAVLQGIRGQVRF
ncbi:MAG: ComEA family DNA-binding protein [Gemmatimonadota bacterium]|jgi:competence protein ComEA